METVYILVILLSIFAHSFDVFYCPQGPSADSALFLIIAPMALQKLKVKNGLGEPKTWLVKIFELGILCLLMQLILVGVWFPVHQVMQTLVDFLCPEHNTAFRYGFLEACRKNAATVVVLAIEMTVLLKYGIYGSRDELVTQRTPPIWERRTRRQIPPEIRERMRERAMQRIRMMRERN